MTKDTSTTQDPTDDYEPPMTPGRAYRMGVRDAEAGQPLNWNGEPEFEGDYRQGHRHARVPSRRGRFIRTAADQIFR